jgi:hypothetical protein
LSVATGAYKKEVYFYENLNKRVSKVVDVPKCYGVFRKKDDPDCREFCLVMEEWEAPTHLPYDQETNPMSMDDLHLLMTNLATFHAAFWDLPIDNDVRGLGPWEDHWNMVGAQIDTAWPIVQSQYEAAFGEPFVRPGNEIDAYVVEIGDLVAANRQKFFTGMLEDLRKRPRTLTHGDARGNNLFKIDNDRIGFIDW